jgi:plasmid stabilization system protein ParE
VVEKVKWTDEAKSQFAFVVDYLVENWTVVEVRHFVKATDQTIEYIKTYPKMFRRIGRRNLFEAMITPHNLMIYKIVKSEIHIITFWDMRRNPKRKKRNTFK